MEQANSRSVLGVTLSEKEHRFLLAFSGFLILIAAINVALQWANGEFVDGLGSVGLILMLVAYRLTQPASGNSRMVPGSTRETRLRLLLLIGASLIAVSLLAQIIRWLA